MAELGKGGIFRDKKAVKLLKLFSIIVIFIIISSFITLSYQKCAAQTSSSYIVMYQPGRQVLSGSGQDARLPMASTTKIVTAIVTLENSKPEDVVTIPKEAVGIEGSSVYLREGERFTVEELLHALMLQSGNDAAAALALYVGKNMDNFVKMMNDYAASLHLENTHFCNPHGLHDDMHYTSAYDLACLTCAAMDNASFAKIVATKKFDVPATEYRSARTWYNKNKMLTMYPGACGVKTGYTTKSGRCLVSSAVRDGMPLVCVVLNHYGMWQDSMDYMDAAFAKYCAVRGAGEGEALYCLPDGTGISVRGGLDFAVEKECVSELNYEIVPAEGHSLPLKTGSEIGNLNVFAGNRLLFSSALYTMNDITSKSALYAAENYRGEVRVKYGSKAEQIYCKQRDGVQEGSR